MSKTIPPLRPWAPGAPTVYVLVGLPGAGKSTWVAKHLSISATPTHVASTDDVLERIALENGITYSQAHANFFKDAEREYKQGIISAAQRNDDIIIDRTNVFASARGKVFSMIESTTRAVYVRQAIVFSVPDEILKERLIEREARTGKRVGWEIVEKMRESYVEPSKEEFHFIQRV